MMEGESIVSLEVSVRLFGMSQTPTDEDDDGIACGTHIALLIPPTEVVAAQFNPSRKSRGVEVVKWVIGSVLGVKSMWQYGRNST